jgi:hypothetical protein
VKKRMKIVLWKKLFYRDIGFIRLIHDKKNWNYFQKQCFYGLLHGLWVF